MAVQVLDPKERGGRGTRRLCRVLPEAVNHERMMGRPPWSSRLTTEECLCFSVVALHRAGVFKNYPGSHWTWKWLPRDRRLGAGSGQKTTLSAVER